MGEGKDRYSEKRPLQHGKCPVATHSKTLSIPGQGMAMREGRCDGLWTGWLKGCGSTRIDKDSVRSLAVGKWRGTQMWFGWAEWVSQQADWLYVYGGALTEEWGWGESQNPRAFGV